MDENSTHSFLTPISLLEPSEYGLLKHVHEGFCPDPATSITLVARKGAEIVGRVFLLSPTHVEGPWVREDLRGGILGHRLMKAAEIEGKSRGITKLFAYAENETMADYLNRLGYMKEPFTVWTKAL